MITKTRKQGNSIMLTVPKEFDVPNGVEVEAKLVENGILYEFVEPKKEFLILVKIFWLIFFQKVIANKRS